MYNTPLPLGKLPAELLQDLLDQLPSHNTNEIIIAPKVGCDAAGLRIGDRLVAVTTDPITFATDRIGTYSVCVNINDIACLGCRPKWFSACLLLPLGTTEATLRAIWQDMTQQLIRYNIQAIGGHTEITPTVQNPIIVGQMIGEVIGDQLLDPTHGQPGDRILLWQGAAIEGTAIIAQERYEELTQHLDPVIIDKMIRLLDNPGICVWPFVKKLVPHPGLVALHDPTEGGIATALHELADACDCGIVIGRHAISILPETQRLATLLNLDPLGLLASGALIIVCRPEAEQTILTQFADEPIAPIGQLTANKDRILLNNGQSQPLSRYHADEIIKGLKSAI